MKRHLILFIALLSLINIGYSQSFSTATDNTCFITITTPQGTSMDARKELCRVHQFSDRVDLIAVDNNLVICTWTKAQAISYGYTLETLEQYLLSILNVSCGGSSGGGTSTEIDYSRVDTTQQDTALDKHVFLDSTLVRITNDTLVVKFADSTYYTQLDSIKYYLSQNDSIEICFDTITFNTNVVNLPITICNGDSAVRVQICNVDTSLNLKVDTTNAILYRLENKGTTDTTHTAILREISDTLTHLAEIVNELKSDCIGSNETYYINGTNTITLNASEVCSYTVTVIEEKLQYSENGVTSPFDLPVGYTGSSSFKNGSKFLINQVSFTGTTANSKAIIKIIK